MTTQDTSDHPDDMLDELAEMSLSLARSLAARFKAAPSAEEAVVLSRAFERLAEGVRLTIALRNGLELEEETEFEERLEAETSWPRLSPAPRRGPVQ
jgi:hypothetical protein